VIGSAQFSEKNTNFMVNLGAAKGKRRNCVNVIVPEGSESQV
jgi:UDP-N-acetylenolpyruvoylglucosamine reductase